MANYQINGSGNVNIFAEVQNRYTVKEIAEQLGIRFHKVGGSLRAKEKTHSRSMKRVTRGTTSWSAGAETWLIYSPV